MDANYFSHRVSSKHHHFGGSASVRDPDVSSSRYNSGQQMHKRCRVVPHKGIQIDGDDHPGSVLITRESNSDYKNKQSMVYGVDRQKEVKGVQSNDLIGSSSGRSYLGVQNDILVNTAAWSVQNDHQGKQYSYDDEGEQYAYDEDDEEFDAELIENDQNYNLSAKLDDLDLPPGASGPWLQRSKPERPIDFDSRAQIEDEIGSKFKSFKQFDIVRDYSDHYYARSSASNMSSKIWTKTIQQEWKILEKDLPEKIFVRAYEARIDLLRAVIIGSAGTPYHDGLFFFDIHFPSDYPQSPPSVYYHSRGLQLNPNLYACGKVCLSLLNTWTGRGCEKWNPSYSTMLQVLVSIQALVLNSKPYFNEPMHSSAANTFHGERSSLDYNEKTFLLSCKAMLYSLRRPLKHFEDFVAGHFRKQGRAILVACKAYMRGAQVGSDIKGDEVQAVKKDYRKDYRTAAAIFEAHKDYRTSAAIFKANLKMLFDDLLMEFAAKGADCADFLDQKVKAEAAAAAIQALDTTPWLFGLEFQHRGTNFA